MLDKTYWELSPALHVPLDATRAAARANLRVLYLERFHRPTLTLLDNFMPCRGVSLPERNACSGSSASDTPDPVGFPHVNGALRLGEAVERCWRPRHEGATSRAPQKCAMIDPITYTIHITFGSQGNVIVYHSRGLQTSARGSTCYHNVISSHLGLVGRLRRWILYLGVKAVVGHGSSRFFRMSVFGRSTKRSTFMSELPYDSAAPVSIRYSKTIPK